MNAVTPTGATPGPTPVVIPPAPVTPPAPAPSLTSQVPDPGATPVPPGSVTPEPPAPGTPEPPKAPDAPTVFALDKITLPEGMKADDPSTKAFGDLLANDKLSPLERGQKLLDLYADVTKKGREASTEAWNTVQTEWKTKTLADPDIGGTKWDSAKSTIAKAIDSLGPALAADVRQALDLTGAGNHPAIAKALWTFASKLTEGKHIAGSPSATPVSIKDAFYPNSPDMK